MRHLLSVLVGFAALLSTACSGTAGQPASAGASTKPAVTSRPASEIVLVRVGDTVITQEDFNRECSYMPPERWAGLKVTILRGLIGQRLMNLYLDEHPDLVDPAVLESKIAEVLKSEGVKTRQELEAKVAAQGAPGKLDLYIRRTRMLLGREAMVRQAEKLANDDKYMQELFAKTPSHFDGTSMFVRQIRTSILPWDTPEQIQLKRNKMEKIRADLVAGRRTWEECVTESDDPTRITGGELGFVPRHMEEPEVISKAAFELQPGQTSEVLSDRNAFYIIQVTKTNKGDWKFDRAKVDMKLWVQWEPLYNLELSMRTKHPIVGVREPDLPPPPASRPAPVIENRRGPVTRPAGAQTRPAQNRLTTRPGWAQNRPATRPANTRIAPRPANASRVTTRPAPAPRPPVRPNAQKPAMTPATQPR